jgi:Ca2+-binding RTX toxin-like protein
MKTDIAVAIGLILSAGIIYIGPIESKASSPTLESKASSPTLECNGIIATIEIIASSGEVPTMVYGTPGDDVIVVISDGISPADKVWVFGDAGNDTICSNVSDSIIWGGEGNDWIQSNGSNDYLDGNRGDDELFGGGGSDFLRGGYGNDTLHGEGNDDIFKGNSGKDTFDCSDGDDTVSDYDSSKDMIISCELY